jgi:hypothetical protein
MDRFSENTQVPNFIKILPVGAESFHADRRTGRRKGEKTDRLDEVNSRFSQFCERDEQLRFWYLSNLVTNLEKPSCVDIASVLCVLQLISLRSCKSTQQDVDQRSSLLKTCFIYIEGKVQLPRA